jgi:hypothetical protein
MTPLRWVTVVLALAVASILLLLAWPPARLPNVDPKQEALFQDRLRFYREALPAGLTRKQVTEWLRARNVAFHESCCDENRMSYHVIKAGVQPVPWYRSEWTVYIAIHYKMADPPGDPKESRGTARDSLADIDLESRGEGCL